MLILVGIGLTPAMTHHSAIAPAADSTRSIDVEGTVEINTTHPYGSTGQPRHSGTHGAGFSLE